MIARLARDGFASFVGFGRGIWLFPLDTMFRTVGLRYGWLKALFIATPAPLMRGIGRLRAERAAWRATRRVPAYGQYLRESGVDVDGLFPQGILRHLPETDKKSYVDRYGANGTCAGFAVSSPWYCRTACCFQGRSPTIFGSRVPMRPTGKSGPPLAKQMPKSLS